MALIQFGDLITGMRGSVGGSTYGNSASGFTRRNKTNPIQPVSSNRSLTRNRFASTLQSWRTLDDGQRLAWIAATANFPRVNSLGNTYYMSGINLFAAMNQTLISQNQTPIVDPPDNYSFPALTIDTLTCSRGSNLLQINYDDSAFVTCEFIILATGSLSAGVSSPRGNFIHINSIAEGAGMPFNLWDSYVARFGYPITGMRLFVKVTPYRTDSGQQSTPVLATCIVAS